MIIRVARWRCCRMTESRLSVNCELEEVAVMNYELLVHAFKGFDRVARVH